MVSAGTKENQSVHFLITCANIRGRKEFSRRKLKNKDGFPNANILIETNQAPYLQEFREGGWGEVRGPVAV